MPELPEVQAMTERLQRALRGRKIVSAHIRRPRTVAPVRPAEFERRLRGLRITSVERRAKTIRIDLATGRSGGRPGRAEYALLAHMRMTGHLFVQPAASDAEMKSRVAAWFDLDARRRLLFDDPRGLGTLSLLSSADADDVLSKLGVEPLSPEFTAARLFDMLRSRRLPAKLFLMNQRHIAGLGNIYAAEALWRAQVDPRRPASTLTRNEAGKLYRGIVSVLKEATKSALKHYDRPGSIREAEGFRPDVYQREGQPCHRCGWPIRRIVQGGRSTFFCPNCQR